MSLAQLLEIEKDVTPGPWKIEPILDWSGRFAINKDHAMISTVNNEANAAFIAAARNAIPEIKAMAEALTKLADRGFDWSADCGGELSYDEWVLHVAQNALGASHD